MGKISSAGKHLTEHVHRVEEREEEVIDESKIAGNALCFPAAAAINVSINVSMQTHLEDPIIVAHPLPPPPAPPSPPLLPLPAATTTSTTPSPLIPPNVPYNNEK